jgi:catechol 2,3-dioxygenase-like lactoylglutathione lyase family enzyme
MSNFIRITPCMVVDDVDRAVRFFVEILGFTPIIEGGGNYAYVERETVAVRIIKASTSPGEIPGPGTRSFRYYIDVKDVDAVAAEVKPKLAALWSGRVHGPVTQRYGQREFMIESPDGDLVVFGQETSEPTP